MDVVRKVPLMWLLSSFATFLEGKHKSVNFA